MGRIKFGVYKTPKGNGTEQQSCARLISKGTMRMEEICEYLSDSSSLTSADIKGVIEALTTYIGRNLSHGYCVELEGFGHFSPALKTLQKTDEKGRTGGEKDHDLDHVFQHAFKYRTSGASCDTSHKYAGGPEAVPRRK